MSTYAPELLNYDEIVGEGPDISNPTNLPLLKVGQCLSSTTLV